MFEQNNQEPSSQAEPELTSPQKSEQAKTPHPQAKQMATQALELALLLPSNPLVQALELAVLL